MEDINGGLHPAVDGQSLDEDENSLTELKEEKEGRPGEFSPARLGVCCRE